MKKRAVRVENGNCFPVFTGGIVLRCRDKAAQLLRHQLAAVADPQKGNTQLENTGVRFWGIGQIDAVRSAGEDYACGLKSLYFCQRHVVRMHFAVNMLFPNSSGDQLIILSAKVQDQYLLHLWFLQRSGNQPDKQGMRPVGTAFELRMKLYADIKAFFS